MHVFVAGATGVLGRNILRSLRACGHHATGLVRDDDGAQTVRDLDATPHSGDVFDQESLIAGAAGADAIVHAASKLPVDPPTTAREWRANDRVRLAATRNLLSAARTQDVSRFVFPSLVWAYDDPGVEYVSEDSPAIPDRTTASAVETEALLHDAQRNDPISPTILRLGWLYGPTSAQTQQIATELLDGGFFTPARGLLGTRDSQLSMIHAQDAASAIVAALEANLEGTYHVVDDHPLTASDFFERFASALGADTPSRAPAWLARQFVGRDMVRFLTQSFPTTNTRFRHATDWSPAYPTIESGLEAVINEWLDAGWLTPHADGYHWTPDSTPSRQCRSCGHRTHSFYDDCQHCGTPSLTPDPF